ncbi:uncharacterized protein LOC129771962 isoform X2 [Toxorhynchites rutilus septentrionalis]|uniref:uncharacterized protein LOC129771962 isoform X2 n=1 Tax=Toxorhynchites rutilus septentrionalis TaxID=329112 RepID=UPI002478DD41|nr:uncharacterized protein LOC129771962 isoform X2 [Toxorhynchites rutilus septentrionalis]
MASTSKAIGASNLTTADGKNQNKKTTEKQCERMVLLLEQEADIAKGFTRGNSGPFWNNLAAEVNSLEPPIRDGTGWKKVWADSKSAQRKLTHNKREQRATGEAPNKNINLSKLERQDDFIWNC